MKSAFLATLGPMLTLFICIALGFISKRAKLLPDNAGNVMAKMENWLFCPALSFSATATYFTVDRLTSNAVNISFSCIALAIAMAIAIPLSKAFVNKPGAERGVYIYALTFANFGYMGDPVVLALFGEEIFAYYKLFCLPLNVMIYVFGIGILVPSSDKSIMGRLKSFLNAPTVALFIGMAVGLLGLGAHIPTPVTDALDSLKSCMGPVAMLLAGFTVAKYDVRSMLKNLKIYVATALRLIFIPTLIIACLVGVRALITLIPGITIDNGVLFLAFFATAMPLGLNTVVFPEAYGGNPEIGAGMALISNPIGVLTIPLMYALMTLIFGAPIF